MRGALDSIARISADEMGVALVGVMEWDVDPVAAVETLQRLSP